MSLVCALSNETPEEPVISPKSGYIFERRLILKYLEENGIDPFSQQCLSPDDLIPIKTSPLILPKPPTATSIPAILKALQDEWDAVLLQSFALRQQLQTARQELSHALYQNDAACRVIARLTKEVTAAREALATLKPQTNLPVYVSKMETEAVGADNNIQEAIGISQDVITEMQQRSSELTAERKRRGKTVPEGLASSTDISSYQQTASHTGIHSSSLPGLLCLDISLAKPELIVTGGNDKNAVIFNLQTEQITATLSGHAKKVTRVAYHPTEQLCFTGSQDQTVRVWGVDQGHCASVLRAHTGAITGLSVHATGNYLLSSATDGRWAFSDLRKGKVLARVGEPTASYEPLPSLTCAQFHPDGQILGVGTGDGEIKIWEIRVKKNVANFGHGSGPGQDVTAIAFSENGYFLATGGKDGQIKLWDLRKLKNFKVIIPEEERSDEPYVINDLEFDQSGSYLAVAGSDVRVYLSKQWDQLSCFTAHTSNATGVRFGRNATSVISSSLDRSVKIYSQHMN